MLGYYGSTDDSIAAGMFLMSAGALIVGYCLLCHWLRKRYFSTPAQALLNENVGSASPDAEPEAV